MKTISYAIILALCVIFLPGAATAQISKPITIVVPYPPGGPYDIFARIVSPKLSKYIGQTVVIENRGGANGNLGAAYVSKAEPDGRTLLMLGSVHIINASLYKNLTYSVTKDLVPAAPIGSMDFVLLVHPSVPANSLQELLALAKSKPGDLTYASGGSGSVGHLAAVMMNTMSGTKMVHVPYRGTGPALTDTIGGQCNIFFAVPAASQQYIKSGQLKALAVTSLKRSPVLPNVPTMAESGIPGYEATMWLGIGAPAGTPKDIVQRLNASVNKAVHDPETLKLMQIQGGEPLTMSVDELAAFVRKDIAKWAAVVKASGATVD
ncbi:MAG: Bug family tripartite tricarboxylate transporter substrate binding protein [Syntrophales bacterium]